LAGAAGLGPAVLSGVRHMPAGSDAVAAGGRTLMPISTS
jgi:hypothetical protein